MTYYEELGVSSAASFDEIREAYKQLARLLHPDKIQDKKLRGVAECQMRRLNQVYETLSVADLRREYDLSLQTELMMVPRPAEMDFRTLWRICLERVKGPDGAWIGAGALVAALMIWTLLDSPPVRAPDGAAAPVNHQQKLSKVREKPVANPNLGMEQQIVMLRRQLEVMRQERDAALSELAVMEAGRFPMTAGSPEQGSSQQSSAGQTLPSAGTLQAGTGEMRASLSVPPAPTPAPRAAAETMSGTWYFTPDPNQTPTLKLYPPEYIEAVITERGGVVLGRYRARYRVTDRAISPEVMFQFSGKAAADNAKVPWQGAGGASGEVKLRLLTRNSLEVSWIANNLGTALGLGSGQAVLIRKYDPAMEVQRD